MAQAWASLAVLTAGSQAAPKIPTSCRRSSDRSQTVVQLPACLAPQFEPHVVPSRRVPRLSSLALTRIRQRLLGCRIFTPAQPSHSAASSEGFLLRRLQHPNEKTMTLVAISVSHLESHWDVQLELPLDLADEKRRPGTRRGMARSTADRAIDMIRDRFGWDAVGYGSVLLGPSRSVPDEFRELAEKDL